MNTHREELLKHAHNYSVAMQRWGFALAGFALRDGTTPALDEAANAANETYKTLIEAIGQSSGQPEWLNQALNEGDGTYKP